MPVCPLLESEDLNAQEVACGMVNHRILLLVLSKLSASTGQLHVNRANRQTVDQKLGQLVDWMI